MALIMGSRSDWDTMRHAAGLLEDLQITYRSLVVSAHRTPERLVSFAKAARSERAFASLSPARAARPICRAWWRL